MVGPWCPRCHEELESDWHSLFKCQRSKIFWDSFPFWQICASLEGLDYVSLISAPRDLRFRAFYGLFVVRLVHLKQACDG